MKQIEKNDLFQASQLSILLSYTSFSVILLIESILMGWEKWPLFIIAACIVVSWILHLQQKMNDKARIWTYAACVMFTFFFYGSHQTSVFDTAGVMALGMLIFTMTFMKPLITFLQILYYVTFGYGLVAMSNAGVNFDLLMISRILLHFAVITATGSISRTAIDKWTQVLGASHDEIEKLTETTERLNHFLANVSHETRTPINAIIGLSNICIDEEEDSEKRTNLIAVRDAGRRVADQISDILDFTEIDRKELTNNYEDYMLDSLLNDLVSEIRPFKPKELELVIDVDAAIPSVMNTDVSKLRKILKHLIMNGIKYTKAGGIYVRLYAIPEPYGVNLVIKITDTGIGMTEEQLERIYERYYQADSGKTRQGGGLGLGLTIVSGFTSALGGFMTVNSEKDVGTTVSVSIPQKVVERTSCMSISKPENLCLGAFLHLDKYADPHVREYYDGMIHNIVKGFGVQMHRVDNAANLKKLMESVRLTHLFVSEEEYEAAADLIEAAASKVVVVVVANSDYQLPANTKVRLMKKPFYCFPVAAILNEDHSEPVSDEVLFWNDIHALVVDDEPMNLTVAKNILKRYGIAVTTANSGMEAVNMCSEQTFDIIFMDHMMPGMDGVETMKRIRTSQAKERITTPIVALTANAVSTARESFLSAGFDGFVSKPIELTELERVLRRVLPPSAAKAKPHHEKPESAPVSEYTPPEKKKLPLLGRLNAIGLDTGSALHYCADDEAFYITLLEQFTAETDSKIEQMNDFLRADDLVNYEILIHALKNTLKLIGSDALSNRAKALEFAAKDENTALIAEDHAPLTADCRTLIGRIREVCGFSADTPADDADEVIEFIPEESGNEIIEDAADAAEEV